MKKFLLTLALAAALPQIMFAQAGTSGATFVITPSSQSVAAGGTFNVDFSLTGTPPPDTIAGYDLYLVTAAANSGFFSITSSDATGSPFNALGPDPSDFPDTLNAAAQAGFVRNNANLGYVGDSQNPPFNIFLQTITISLSPSVAPGTYTFFTSTTANAGGFFSDVFDSGPVFEVPQGQFSVTVVPEPSTWSLFGLGAVGLVGLMALRRRREA